MHAAALEWVSRFADRSRVAVLDIGGRDINGTCRPAFPNADYRVLDIIEADGVDIVADAATWIPDRTYDVVLCVEVFEHTAVWEQICATAHKALRPGGRLVVTAAGPGRAPHSAYDGAQLHADEFYANIEPGDLREALEGAGFADVDVDQLGDDVRASAVKP